jgi:hypothetical protein
MFSHPFRRIAVVGALLTPLFLCPSALATPSTQQLTASNICPKDPVPGTATCVGEVVRVKATGQLYRPPAPTPVEAASRRSELKSKVLTAPIFGQPRAGTAAWLQQAYDLTWLSANEGYGDTVAVVDVGDDLSLDQDLARYRTANGLAPCTESNGCLTVVNQWGQTEAQATEPGGEGWPSSADVGWQDETDLDTQAVSALCPNCHLLVVEAATDGSDDLASADGTAGDWPGVEQVSDSFGNSEPGSTDPLDDVAALVPTSVSVLASSGDYGYNPQGFYPANDPGVTSVGGTTLQDGATTGSRGFTELAWSGSGYGCATTVSQPAWQNACAGLYSPDISADADPMTGLDFFDSASASGGWGSMGGTSLAAPLVAAFEAITGTSAAPNYTTPEWAYADQAFLNPVPDPTTSDGENPAGVGSISGALVPGAPGIAAPDVCLNDSCQPLPGELSREGTPETSYTESATPHRLHLKAGLYTNQLPTTYYWEYGTTRAALGQRTPTYSTPASEMLSTIRTTIGKLTPGTFYYYRLVASNADGMAYGGLSSGLTVREAQTMTLTTAVSPGLIPADTAEGIKTALIHGYRLRFDGPTNTSLDITWSYIASSGVLSDTLIDAGQSARISMSRRSVRRLLGHLTSASQSGQSIALNLSVCELRGDSQSNFTQDWCNNYAVKLGASSQLAVP